MLSNLLTTSTKQLISDQAQTEQSEIGHDVIFLWERVGRTSQLYASFAAILMDCALADTASVPVNNV